MPDDSMVPVTDDLVARLRDRINGTGVWRTAGPDEDMQALADRITTLERELAEARKERDSYGRLYLDEIDRAISIDDELVASQAEVERLREALAGLVEKLDVVHGDSRYESVWAIAQLHGGVPYSGPTYTAELATARAAITRQGETG